jgi:ribonuclease P protein component
MTGHAPAQTRTAQESASRLRRRRDFLRAAAGDQFHMPCFKLQSAARTPDEPGPPRIGFTVTKKVAGAVGRNRIRRRLREEQRLGGALAAREGHDYVFIARAAAMSAPFAELKIQMAQGLAQIHEHRAGRRRRNSKDRPSAP